MPEFIGDYLNPTLIGEEALDRIYVEAQAYQPEDVADSRVGVLCSAIMNGTPGFTRQSLWAPQKALDQAHKVEELHARSTPQAVDRRQVTVYLEKQGAKAIVGLVVYDSSVPLGAPDSVRPDGKLARETIFAVASGAPKVEYFTANQRCTIGTALGYSALKDMQAQGFERVRYEFEGLGLKIKPEEAVYPNGVALELAMAKWQAAYPWLGDK